MYCVSVFACVHGVRIHVQECLCVKLKELKLKLN